MMYVSSLKQDFLLPTASHRLFIFLHRLFIFLINNDHLRCERIILSDSNVPTGLPQVAQWLKKKTKTHLPMQETLVQPLDWVDPLEEDNLLQFSCLENPTDRGAWRATVHGVAKSQTLLCTSSHTMSLLGTSKEKQQFLPGDVNCLLTFRAWTYFGFQFCHSHPRSGPFSADRGLQQLFIR